MGHVPIVGGLNHQNQRFHPRIMGAGNLHPSEIKNYSWKPFQFMKVSGPNFFIDVGNGQGAASSDRASYRASGVGDMRDGRWHHYCWVIRNGERAVAFYLDGVAKSVAKVDGGATYINFSGGAWRCNVTDWRDTTPVPGVEMADIRLYTPRELSASEVFAISRGRS